ncbi:MAG: YezD family protein [Nitrosomonas sp.]|nr:MAG: YezD family protein [Nitrosomonas sp.]
MRLLFLGLFQEMTQLSTTHENSQLSTHIIEKILDAVGSIEYGSVEVVIHDGKVVQIECRKKIRVNRGEVARR